MPPLDARARRSQDALLRAGLELLNFNKEATLSDIAAHAGVGRTTLYRQYETREKLVSAIALYCLETYDELIAPIDHEATSVLDAIRLLFDYAMPLTEELQFLMTLDEVAGSDPSLEAIIAKQARETQELVEAGKQEGAIDSTLPTSWVAHLIEGLFIVGWVQQRDEGFTASQAASLAFRSFCSGVSPSRS